MNDKLSLEQRVHRLESLVYEAKQVGTLYHVCSLAAYLKFIAPTNTLKASGKFKNRLYKSNQYVSFTRDKYFVVNTKHNQDNIMVQLVIDGDKLSENYKIGPYNAMDYTRGGKIAKHTSNPKFREMEEAVKGPIKNISKYIKEIRFDCYNIYDDDFKDLAKLPSDAIYYNFIKYNKDKYLELYIKNNISNGMSVNEATSLLDKYIKRNKSVVKKFIDLCNACGFSKPESWPWGLGCDISLEDIGETMEQKYKRDKFTLQLSYGDDSAYIMGKWPIKNILDLNPKQFKSKIIQVIKENMIDN